MNHYQRLSAPRFLMATALSVVAGTTAYICGNWPAVLLLAAARLLHAAANAANRNLLLFGIPGFWLLLQHLSGDRRLFFSWSMGLAACVMTAGSTRTAASRFGSAGIITVLFLAIRIQQQAPQRVLLIEALAAAGILCLVVIPGRGIHGRFLTDACTVAAASILACFSLAI